MPFFHHIIIYNENVLLICNLYYIHNSYIHGLLFIHLNYNCALSESLFLRHSEQSAMSSTMSQTV